MDEDEVEDPVVSPLPRRVGTHLRARRSRGFAAIAAVLLLAILTGTIFTLRTLTPALTPHPGAPVELAVFPNDQSAPACQSGSAGQSVSCPLSHYVCPRDAAWSPDERRVALVSFCSNIPQHDARIFVYDTHSGRRLSDVSLVATLQRLPSLPVPGHTTSLCAFGLPGAEPSITATMLLWSRDGAWLDVPFYLNYTTHFAATVVCYGWLGLLRVHPDGSAPQAFYHAYGDDTTSATAPANYDCSSVWDVATERLVPMSVDTTPAGEAFGCLAPALSYSWNADGTLSPATRLPAGGAPAIGACPASSNPNGAASVSIWQPGAISRQAAPQPYQNTPAFYVWTTSPFAGASPDGRYVVSNPSLVGLLDVPGQRLPDSAAVAASGVVASPGALPVLPVPGQGIEQRLAALPVGYTATQDIAFRPDGRVIAAGGIDAWATNGGQTQHVSKPVTLYTCASGRALATLTPIFDARYAGHVASTLLRWSPDGKYLLYADSAYGAATLWGPNSLPR